MKDHKRRSRGAAIARPSEVYIRDLEPEEQQMIEELSHRTPDAMIKTRCQIIVLEASPMSVPVLATCAVSRTMREPPQSART